MRRKFDLTEKQFIDLVRMTRHGSSYDELWKRYGCEMGFDPATVEQTERHWFTAEEAPITEYSDR